MRIEGIDEDIRARLLKTLARFPHIEEIQVTEGLPERLLGNHFGSHLGHLPGHRIYVRTVNLGQPWRKIEERVKEIVKEEDEGAGEDGGPSDGIAWNGGERETRLRLEEKAGTASATKGGRSCFYYEGRKEMLLLRREEGDASASREDEREL